jgi:hypothetical protein
LFDQDARLLRGTFGFRGGVTFDMDERGYERDLKLDLFAAQQTWRAASRFAKALASTV